MKHVTAPLLQTTGTTSNFNSYPIGKLSTAIGRITLMLLFLLISQAGVVAQICNPPAVSDASATLPNNCTTIPTISGQSGNVFELTINPANKYTFTICFDATSTGNSQFPQAELWDDLTGTFIAATGGADANNCTTVSYTPPADCTSSDMLVYLATYSHQCISDWRALSINVTCEGCTIDCGAPSFAAANNTGCTSFAFEVPGPTVSGSCADNEVTFVASAELAPFAVVTTSSSGATPTAGDGIAIGAGAPVGTHTITYSVEDCAGVVVSCDKLVVIEPILACDDVVNVTLSQFCEMQITANMLLEAECADESQYTVNILGQTNAIISAPGLYEVQIVYTPDVANSASGTFCWGYINAEDKSGPVCTLDDTQILVSCGEDPMAGEPVFTDCSTVASTNKVTIDYGQCGDINTDTDGNGDLYDDLPFVVNSNVTIPALDPASPEVMAYIAAGFVIDHVTLNMWTATDGNGFSSSSCQQFIYVWRPSTVNPPLPSITVECGSTIDQTTLASIDPQFVPNYINPKYGTDTNPANDLEFTMVDNDGDLQFLPITDVDHTLCKFTVDSEDNLVAELCGLTEKYIREFTVLDWCAGSIVIDGFNQVIKIEDTTAPIFQTCPGATAVGGSFANPQILNTSSAAPGQCGFTGVLTAPTATDACSMPVTYSANIYTSGGTGTGYALVSQVQDLSNAVSLITRDYRVDYIATDDCGNVSNVCPIYYNIVDNDSPVAICDEQTTISLTNANNGVANICADNLDSGSYDNCGITSTMVKRMGANDNTFAACLPVDCTDVGQDLMVVLRVVDAAGNSNVCMVTVQVQDKVGAEIVCPSDAQVTCLQPTSIDATGDVIMNATAVSGINGYAFDNCNINAVTNTDLSNTVDCGSGTIQREFTAFTSAGVASCVQTITVIPDYDYFVTFPADVTITNCASFTNIGDVGEPIISGVTCGEIGVNVEDQTYVIASGSCNRVLRTYTLKNTCLDVTPANATDGGIAVAGSPLKFQDDGDGYFRYTQTIDIVDNVAPVFNECTDRFFDTFSTACTANVNIDLSATDDCSNELDYFWKVDLYADGNDDEFGFNNTIDEVLPVGSHAAFVQVSDGCGNSQTCNFIIQVRDVKEPTLICVDLYSAIMNGDAQSVTIWASDFVVTGSTLDNCTPSGDLVVTAALGTTAGVESSQTNIVVRCEDLIRDANGNVLPTTLPVRVFVKDAAGNSAFCETNISVRDNGNNCGASGTGTAAQISGRIFNENDEDVEDVMVQVESNSMSMTPYLTETDGYFVFSDLTMHGDYSIQPAKDINPANGVSTYDLILLTRHILELDRLENPYKIIAADVNGDGTLNIGDLIEVRQMILFAISEFSSKKSWRFIDSEYQFNNSANPLAENFPEIIDFADLSADGDADFLGVKLGDLDGDSYANRLLDVVSRSQYPTANLLVNDKEILAGESIEIPFGISEMDKMSAMQFTVEFDPNNLEFTGINAGSLDVEESNFGYTMIQSGILTFSWNSFSGKVINLDDQDLFSLSFIAKNSSTVANEVSVSSKYTSAIAFNDEGQYNVGMNILSENGSVVNADDFKLYQNEPNPFKTNTKIGFNLPEAAAATLRIMDVSGKELRVITDNFSRGYNEVNIDINALSAKGVLYYQLETATHAATNKMIVIE